jgi:hypothetical protein
MQDAHTVTTPGLRTGRDLATPSALLAVASARAAALSLQAVQDELATWSPTSAEARLLVGRLMDVAAHARALAIIVEATHT